jgi:hypothetical protein
MILNTNNESSTNYSFKVVLLHAYTRKGTKKLTGAANASQNMSITVIKLKKLCIAYWWDKSFIKRIMQPVYFK